MFESQYDWFEHEVNLHRKLWGRKICMGQLPNPDGSYSELPYSKPDLVKHLQYRHTLSDEVINELELESWRKPRIDATK
jgi:hypothetical protein